MCFDLFKFHLNILSNFPVNMPSLNCTSIIAVMVVVGTLVAAVLVAVVVDTRCLLVSCTSHP